MKWVPRDYQQAAHEALWEQVHHRPGENPLVVIPTGAGKSGIMGMFVWHILATYPMVRILNLVHVKELVKGNHDALKTLWPAAPAGMYSAGLGRKDSLSTRVLFAGIQSFRNVAGAAGKFDFVLVDEAHRISPRGAASYAAAISKLREVNPHLIVIGFTATPFRMGTGELADGSMFDRVCFDLSDGKAFVWLIDNGYLIKPVPKHPGFQLDSEDIAISAGDYDNLQTSAAMQEQHILERAVDSMIQMADEQGRRAWLTFCQSIEDAEAVADMFTFKGYPVEAVHSKRGDRDQVLAKFRRGELIGVTNKDILTTGFDDPRIDMIGMLRLTRSPGLWVQMLGRGTRPSWPAGAGAGPHHQYDITTLEGRQQAILASHKQTCLVLDFVGNTGRLGPINYPRIPQRRRPGGAAAGGAPVRLCPECDTYNHISSVACEECGYEFPLPPPRVQPNASTEQLVRREQKSIRIEDLPKPEPKQIETFVVDRMICSHHKGKNGKRDTMRVDYFSGMQRFSSWVCFGHPPEGFPRRKAEEWWDEHVGEGVAPYDIQDAVEVVDAKGVKPTTIRVWLNTRYPEVVDYIFSPEAEQPDESAGIKELRSMIDDDLLQF